MKGAFAVTAVLVLIGCGSSTAPSLAAWGGTWRLQETNASGWSVFLSQADVSLRDSASAIWGSVPAVTVTDDNNTDPVSFSGANPVKSVAVRADSLSLTINGTGGNTGFTYQLQIVGTRGGSTASGLLILSLQGGGGSSEVGAWSATKQ